ncbi:MAG: efflux RND transporter periplasmic adaptor subunit [Candidatus Eremiobacteraeota bacterium]|nr:efflux RND transporter periplasmic adaptor subunit [Candidatus Eremiobacteraeota bacterium]
MNVLRRYWALALVAVAIIVVVVVRHRHAQEAAPVQPAVQVARAVEGDLLVRVTAHGRVGPPPGSASALAFAVAGRLESVDVRVGDRVQAGQALAQLDAAPFQLAVSQAGGDAQAAAANLASVTSGVAVRNQEAAAATRQADLKVQADRAALERTRALFSAGIAAVKDVQTAQNQLAADEADARTAHLRAQALIAGAGANVGQARADVQAASGQATRAQASLAIAERDLANATLRAPADGIIVAILKHPGESVDPSTPAVTLGAPLVHSATLTVPADAARQIKVGDPVELHLARSSLSYRGRVTAAVNAVDPATLGATVVVSGIPADAFAGDAVDASITVAIAHGILVPTSAVVEDPQSGDMLVFVASDRSGAQTFSPRKVTIGASDQHTTQIASGLRAGEVVATEGAFELLAPAGTSD